MNVFTAPRTTIAAPPPPSRLLDLETQHLLARLLGICLHTSLHPLARFCGILLHLGLILEQFLDLVRIRHMATLLDAGSLGHALLPSLEVREVFDLNTCPAC